MSCPPCAAAAAASYAAVASYAATVTPDNQEGSYASYQSAPYTPNPDCAMTPEVLYKWRDALTCIKNSGKQNIIGLTVQEINRYLGIIQSAINYPDDHCYYESRYLPFKDNVLPLIITNAPECL